jgi:hypothetical protein
VKNKQFSLCGASACIAASRHGLNSKTGRVGMRLILLASLAAPMAMADLADQVAYNITFTGIGVLPAAGSFIYDPDTTTFSSFFVTWDNISFDLTAAANHPTVNPIAGEPACIGGLTGAAAGFAEITGACPNSDSGVFWAGDAEIDHSALFDFHVIAPPTGPGIPEIEIFDVSQSGPASHDTGSGKWIATEEGTLAPVPEPPSAVLLLLTALVSIAVLAKRRIGQLIR